jgi:hypothetical protein
VRFKNFLIYLSRRIGFYPTPLLGRQDFQQLKRFLKPIVNGHELIRVGSESDGGYLIPHDLDGISALISPGVSDNMQFEIAIYEQFKIISFMYDGSVEAPTEITPNQYFFKKFVGPVTNGDCVNLNHILEIDLKGVKGDLIAQIDIEGAEVEFMNASSSDDLKRFRIIVVEFHELDRWLQKRYYFEKIKPLFERIYCDFDLVHYHPNTLSERLKYFSEHLPKTIELTFHRKDRAINYDGFAALPHPLDKNNS